MKTSSWFSAIVALAMTAATLFAAERHPFDAAKFQGAVEAGNPVLVHVTAPWCGECKKQKPIVAKLSELPEFSSLQIFDVDFDTQKGALRLLKVQKQSTLIVYKMKTEQGRAVGITRPEKIEALLRKAL